MKRWGLAPNHMTHTALINGHCIEQKTNLKDEVTYFNEAIGFGPKSYDSYSIDQWTLHRAEDEFKRRGDLFQ